MKSRLLVLMLGAWFLMLPLRATEGAMGRPISGAAIMPYAGVVPPEPGAYFLAAGEFYYTGDMGGSAATPVGSNLTLKLNAKVSFTPLVLLYIWKTPDPAWNWSSSITFPITWTEATADITLGPRTGHIKEDNFGLYDLCFTPFVVSHHLSETEHASFGLTVWAPTGEYDPASLVSLGLNNWTFIPTASYTKIDPTTNFETSVTWGVQFYTENHATDYRSGILSDFEFTFIKRGASGSGLGFVGSWIEQLTDDKGGHADALDGFRGRAFGAGIIATWSKEYGRHSVSGDLRWVHEFENRNRLEGDLFMLNLSVKL